MTSGDRQAGAAILNELALFNKAAIYMETAIEPEVRREISAVVSGWLESHAWNGESDASEELEAIWVAPPHWADEADTDPVAHFSLSGRSGSDSTSYEIADLFGVGETNYGFRFEVDHRVFGGRIGWNAYAKTLDVGQELGKQGWVHEGKGVFFRPLVLRYDLLEEAWINEDWSEATAPITRGLDAIELAVPIFDKIIIGAKIL